MAAKPPYFPLFPYDPGVSATFWQWHSRGQRFGSACLHQDQPKGWSFSFPKTLRRIGEDRTPREGCPYGAPKVCHPERRAKPEVEGSSHRMAPVQTVSARILRLAALAQDDRLGLRPPLRRHAKRTGTKREHVIANQCAHWCGNPVDFAGTTNGRFRSISGIATSGYALLAMTCSFSGCCRARCLRTAPDGTPGTAFPTK